METTDQPRRDPRTTRARALRNAATSAERRLWRALRQQSVTGHFRRQVPIGPYFVDFAHLGLKLIVEIDGDSHAVPHGIAHDEARSRYLEKAGFRILRFWNNEVYGNLDGVIETILAEAALHSPPHPCPSPPQAGGG